MLMEPVRRLRSDERGIAMIVVMVMMLILGTLAAAVFTNSLDIKKATATERAGKQSYAAALNGLRSAMYWLNASAPNDNTCPPLPGQTVQLAPSGTNGLCGPYESDNVSGVTGLATQPLVKQRFTYWITPVMGSGADTCTGHPPAVTNSGTGTVVRDRCITAIGQSLNGSSVTATRRVQSRVSATNAQFPVPGIFGAACLSIGVNVHAGDTTAGCEHQGSGVSNSDYYGTIGSNGRVDANMKSWQFDPEDSAHANAPAELYLGYSDPTSSTIPQYQVKLQDNPVGTPNPTGCAGSGLNYCNGSLPPLPYNTSATGPYQNPVHLFGGWYQPFRMGDFFAHPEVFAKFVIPGHSLPTGCAATDVSICNNNSLITTASSTPTGCATVDSSRSLSVPQSCVLRLQNGTYDFCDITVGKSAALLPVDTSANAEIRIFLDNKLRSVPDPSNPTTSNPACASSTQGNLNWPANTYPRWMTNNGTQVSAADCINSAFNGDTWTALAGQLYVYGAGDPAALNNYPVNANDAVDFPGLNFNGSIIATNSTVNLTDSSTCINGGITGGQVNIANNAGFKWDANIAKAHLSDTAKTFFRTAFSTCTARGFQFTSTATAPAYPTYPSDGC
jgi:Tfp pilus assembly protein PilX